MSRRNTTIFVILPLGTVMLVVALALFFAPWRNVSYSGTLIATQTGVQAIRGTVRLAASADDAGLGLSGDQGVVGLRDLYEDLELSELHEGEDIDKLYRGRSFDPMPGLGIAALCLLIGAVASAVMLVVRSRHWTTLVPAMMVWLAYFLWPIASFPIEDALHFDLILKAVTSNADTATTGVDSTLSYSIVSGMVVVAAVWFLVSASVHVRRTATTTEP